MKRFSKCLLFFICLMGVITISSQSAKADDGWGTWGNNISWTYTESTGVLKLEGSGAMEKGSFSWKSYHAEVKKIVIGEGITSIAWGAFGDLSRVWSYSNLIEVQLPSTLKEIGTYAFCNASKLTAIKLPDGLEKIGDDAFRETGLIEVEIPKTVTELGGDAFCNCSDLKSIKLYEGIEKIEGGCFAGTKIDHFIMPTSVSELGSKVFANCYQLRYATVNVSLEEDYWFHTNHFDECASLEIVKLTDGVEVLEDACFRNCTKLSAVYVPKSVKTIESKVFSSNDVTLYGYKDSAAYEFAGKTEGVNFVDVSTAAGKKEWESLWNECVNRPAYTLGDVDGNKKVELADAQTVLKAALKIVTLDTAVSRAADVNSDGNVNLADAQLILKYALKIINKF